MIFGHAYAEVHDDLAAALDLHGTEMDDPAAAHVILPPPHFLDNALFSDSLGAPATPDSLQGPAMEISSTFASATPSTRIANSRARVPDPPTGLVATAVGVYQIAVEWDIPMQSALDGTFEKYIIEWSSNNTNWLMIGEERRPLNRHHFFNKTVIY